MHIEDVTTSRNLVELLLSRARRARARRRSCGPSAAAPGNRSAGPRLRAQVCLLAEGLRALGLKDGDRVMLVSENRPEWCIADFAIMAAGCITVPAYVTNTSAIMPMCSTIRARAR